MPVVCHYHAPISPEVVKQPDGKYTLRNIPIFECHTRAGINFDEKWMYACVEAQKKRKAGGFMPRLMIGHTPDSPNYPEKPNAAFLDNYTFDPNRRWLFADFVDVPRDLLDELKSNKWPGRSAEVSQREPAIDVVALLGGSPPYFKLPDVKYEGKTADTISIYSECRMATANPKKLTDEDLKKLYADYCRIKYGDGMPTGGIAPDAAQEADYAKFCELMKRYEAEQTPAAQPSKKPENPAVVDDDEEKKLAAAAAPYSEPTKKEPDVADTIKYEDLVKRIDTLEAEKNTLTDRLETSTWTQKYAEARLPANRLNVADEVKFIMELPADKRQNYFDRSIKAVAAPATAPIKDEPPTGPAALGTEHEASEIKKYYEANRAKYRGDYAAAQRDYRAGKRA